MSLKDISIPEQIELEKRFEFIQDSTLRTNLAITFRYIIFLIGLTEHEPLPGPILYSIYKDMIVQTATIVESTTHYLLKSFIEAEKIKSSEVMDEEWKEEKCSILEEFDDGAKQVCGVVRHKTIKKLTKNTNFVELNRACLRGKLFSKKTFGAAENLRESRNKIHLT